MEDPLECDRLIVSPVSVEVPFHRLEEAQRSIIQMAPPAPAPKANSAKPKGIKRRRHCAVENCNYSTPYSKDLKRHMRKHTGEKPYSCDRCPKSYSRYDKLRGHMRVHDGQRTHKCNLCEYSGMDSGALKKHQRTHSQERPYKCQLCPYAAKDSSQLLVHLRSHTQDTPYFCMEDGCDAAFKTLSDLQRHSRTHTGEKPYSCPHCEYSAAVKSNLNSHLRKQHKGKAAQSPSKTKKVSSSGESGENGILNGNKTVDPFPSSIAQESIVLTDESGMEVRVPPPKPEIATVPKKRTKSEEVNSSASSLPFEFACKRCPYKADTLKLFAQHMKKAHNDSEGSVKLLRASGGKVPGRPRAPRRTKQSRGGNSTPDFQKYYDCTSCSASFVREDSLRCHMRQHSSEPSDPLASLTRAKILPLPMPIQIPMPPPPPPPVPATTEETENIENPENTGGNVVYSYPSFCYHQASPSNLEGLRIETPEMDSQDATASNKNIHNQLELQPPSVITENPGVISNSVPSPHQIYIISPGGSIVQTIQRGDFVLH